METLLGYIKKYNMIKKNPLLFAFEGMRYLNKIDELVGDDKELREKVKLLIFD